MGNRENLRILLKKLNGIRIKEDEVKENEIKTKQDSKKENKSDKDK